MSDGKRRDGVTLAPWKSGLYLCWMQPVQTLLPPRIDRPHATQRPGKVAAAAEERKEEKYSNLLPSHWFSSIAIETMGAVCPKSMALLGHRIVWRQETHRLETIFFSVSQGCTAR